MSIVASTVGGGLVGFFSAGSFLFDRFFAMPNESAFRS